MELPLCQHIKMGGSRCGSPALQGQQYCHFHAGMYRTVPRSNLFVQLFNPRHPEDPNYQYEFPYLDDAESVQVAFMQVIHGVSQELIDPRRAKLILSALHGAAANLRQMKSPAAGREEVAKKRPARVAMAQSRQEGLG